MSGTRDAGLRARPFTVIVSVVTALEIGGALCNAAVAQRASGSLGMVLNGDEMRLDLPAAYLRTLVTALDLAVRLTIANRSPNTK